ncbi:hypothetical protein BJ742DRAFT_787266 [Cladochytrium replicatum]|nr:hypothetical protein BJ742DRAFT_787266 [Cladochytrium replicatum]
MSPGALALFWAVFWLLFLMDPGNKNESVPVKTLLEQASNETLVLANLTFANASFATPIFPELGELHDLDRFHGHNVFYQNVTGLLKGQWTFRNLTLHDGRNRSQSYNQTLSQQFFRDFDFLFRGKSVGSISLNLRANKTALRPASESGKDSESGEAKGADVEEHVLYVEGVVRVKSARKGAVWWSTSLPILVQGVQFVKNGSLMLFGAREGAVYPLSKVTHTAHTNETFEILRSVMNATNALKIEKLQAQLHDDPLAETQVDSMRKPSCSFGIYIQMVPITHGVTQDQVKGLEHELIHEEGIPHIRPPRMQATAVLYSPDCDVYLQADSLVGLRMEVFFGKAVHYVAVVCIITGIELWLTVKQIDYSATQSALSKVSLVSIAMQTIIDAYLFLMNFVTGNVMGPLFLPFVTAAFLKFMLFSVFEMRYLLTIARAQRRDLDDATLGSLFSRFYGTLFVGLFIAYLLSMRVPVLIAIVGFILYSFWVPQIYVNVRRNSRKAYQTSYILGMSVLKLLIPLYLYGCPYSILSYEETHGGVLFALTIWVFIQVGVVIMQDRLGPRTFLPLEWLPHRYDYHPVLPAVDDEAPTLQTGAVDEDGSPDESRPSDAAGGGRWRWRSNPGEKGNAGKVETNRGHPKLNNNDCAICFLPVRVRASDRGAPSAVGPSAESTGGIRDSISRVRALLFGDSGTPINHSVGEGDEVPSENTADLRLNYMVTPCHHIFHTDCLERWMEVKLECPICRTELPPI